MAAPGPCPFASLGFGPQSAFTKELQEPRKLHLQRPWLRGSDASLSESPVSPQEISTIASAPHGRIPAYPPAARLGSAGLRQPEAARNNLQGLRAESTEAEAEARTYFFCLPSVPRTEVALST